MNRKGFTLIELVATFVILGIVVGLSVYSISNIFYNAKEKSEDVFVGTIQDAMDIYISSEDAKKLNFSIECSNTLNKSYGSRKVYKKSITFNDVIYSKYKPIATSDFVNPANDDVECSYNAIVTIYRDEDYIYYYKVNKSGFGCLNDTGVITNLPEGFVC